MIHPHFFDGLFSKIILFGNLIKITLDGQDCQNIKTYIQSL